MNAQIYAFIFIMRLEYFVYFRVHSNEDLGRGLSNIAETYGKTWNNVLKHAYKKNIVIII